MPYNFLLLLSVAYLLKNSPSVSDGRPDWNKNRTFIELFFALNECGKLCYVVHYCPCVGRTVN